MRPARLLHKCWNMMEDQRMESLVVERVPRIARYFGTTVANICLVGGNLPLEQTWIMLAGREYLPKAVLRKSYTLFDQFCADQGIVDGATRWYDLMQDFKAAATHQEIMDAVCAGYDFIQEVRATLPEDESHDEQDPDQGEDVDPAETARDRGNILDMFDEDPPPPDPNAKPSDEEGEAGDEGGEPDDTEPGEPGEGDPSPGKGDKGDDDGDSGSDSGSDPGDGEKGEGGKGEGEGDAKPDEGTEGDPSVGTGEGPEHSPEVKDFKDALNDLVKDWTEDMRLDDDIDELARDIYKNQDLSGEGLVEYPNEPTAMPEDMVNRAEITALYIEQALNTFVTQSAPVWKPRQEVGVIDPLHYRTKSVGDRDYRRQLEDRGNQGLDVHVSMLCDVSGSMAIPRGQAQISIHALSEALYATAVACQNLHIGSTFTIWSSGAQNYRVWGQGEPRPVLWPAMGGTNPNEALDDLDTHNPERAANHLVIIFTDGAWVRGFPSLQRWAAPGRTLVLVRYGKYDGEVQRDMGADKHINIEAVSQLPDELTRALIEVLGRQE